MTISPEGWRKHALLTPAQMGEADRLTIAGGVPGIELMENAGRKVADAVSRRWPPQPVAVLCGPGKQRRRRVCRGARAGRARLAGAPRAARLRRGAARRCGAGCGALAGRGRAADAGGARRRRARRRRASLVRVSRVRSRASRAPSSRRSANGGCRLSRSTSRAAIDGASGEVRGIAPRAAVTVTFFRKKPGHLLLPGRGYCGETVLEQIGIPDAVLDRIAPETVENDPDWWLGAFPRPGLETHKYARGHALVAGGAVMTGAARLAARAAARLGAGLVTVAAPEAAFPIYAAALTGVIVHPVADLDGVPGVSCGPAAQRRADRPGRRCRRRNPRQDVGDSRRRQARGARRRCADLVCRRSRDVVLGDPLALRDDPACRRVFPPVRHRRQTSPSGRAVRRGRAAR